MCSVVSADGAHPAVSEPRFVCGHPLKECDIFAMVSVLMTFTHHFISMDLYCIYRGCVCACDGWESMCVKKTS